MGRQPSTRAIRTFRSRTRVSPIWSLNRSPIFAPDGAYTREFKPGFFGPRDLLFFGEDLVVSDTGHHRLVVLDNEGKIEREIGSKGSGLGEFTEPVGMTELDGRLY